MSQTVLPTVTKAWHGANVDVEADTLTINGVPNAIAKGAAALN